MKILSVSITQEVCGIPLKGRKQLEEALFIALTEKVIEPESLFSNVIHIANMNPNEADKLTQTTLDRALPQVIRNGIWSHAWGEFAEHTNFYGTKTRIFFLNQKEEIYGLEIIPNSYFDAALESEVAKNLGIPQAIKSCTVHAQTTALDSKHFRFNFEHIVRKLDGVLNTHGISGFDIAQTMAKATDSDSDDRKYKYLLHKEPALAVVLTPGNVQKHFVIDYPEDASLPTTFVNSWKVDGSTLTGLLRDVWESEGEKQPPSFTITLSKPKGQEKSWSRELIWEDENRAQILSLTEQIAQALR